jgi:hypothetical protein
MRTIFVLGACVALMAWSVIAQADPIDCTDGCIIITCDGDSCQVYHCNQGTCEPIGSFPMPQMLERDVVDLEAAGTVVQCATEACVVETCAADRICHYWGFRGGGGVQLGKYDRSEWPHSAVDDFLEDSK